MGDSLILFRSRAFTRGRARNIRLDQVVNCRRAFHVRIETEPKEACFKRIVEWDPVHKDFSVIFQEPLKKWS